MTDHPLRTERRKQHLTQAQLAKRAHVAVRSVQNIEAGRHWPRATTRRQLLEALGLTMGDASLIFPCVWHRWHYGRCVRCGVEVGT